MELPLADEALVIDSTPNGDEQTDRRDLLRESFDKVEAEQAQPEAKPEPVKAEAKPATQPRAADGKFAPKDAAAAPAGTEPPKDPVWKRPPASWKKELHEVWNTADPRFQEYAYQREEQMKAGVQPLMEKAKFADAVSQAIQPFMTTIRGLGIDAPTAIRSLMQADHALRTSSPQEKVAYFYRLAQQYGVNLNGADAPAVDVNQSTLAHQLNQLRGEWLGWQEQQKTERLRSIEGRIAKFAETHEHFAAVEDQMTRLLQSGVIEGDDELTRLQNAYDKAIRLDDGLFDQIQKARQAEDLRTQVAAKDAAAKKARSAAVSVKSSTPGTHTAPKAQNRRAQLSEAFDSLSDRL